MRAVRLQTEYLIDPIGIDETRPRLFWNCEGGSQQTAFRIVARDITDELNSHIEPGSTEHISQKNRTYTENSHDRAGAARYIGLKTRTYTVSGSPEDEGNPKGNLKGRDEEEAEKSNMTFTTTDAGEPGVSSAVSDDRKWTEFASAPLLWDSGKITGSSMRVCWGAAPVPARTRVGWSVQVWDEKDQSEGASEMAFFETGLPAGTPWIAKWITGDYQPDKKKRYPVDCFRKKFVIRKRVERARLYMTALGLYEARIDGKKVGNFCLAPGYTDYRKRVQYQTYDVTCYFTEQGKGRRAADAVAVKHPMDVVDNEFANTQRYTGDNFSGIPEEPVSEKNHEKNETERISKETHFADIRSDDLRSEIRSDKAGSEISDLNDRRSVALLPKAHELTVQLADGWFRGSVGAWGRTCEYGIQTQLLGQLELFYTDGTSEIVATDGSWEWSDDGPIRFADNKDGEIVEAFRTPFYGGHARQTDWKVLPTASDNVPVTEHETFHPLRIIKAPNGRYLLDFGQNIAGYIHFGVNASVGQKMIWRFGELLDQDGNLTLKNIQCVSKNKTTPLQKIEYTCGEGRNEYKTTFAIFGFQYAEVEMIGGADISLDPSLIEAIAVYSDLERTGTFTSSNALLNKFFENTVWSTKNNSCDIPTDCPTRERHGWTGDAQVFSSTANYLFDYMPFSKKYLNDMYDWQKRDGKLPQIVPEGGTDPYMAPMNGSVGWADAGVIIPYVLWKQYGDKEVLRKYLPGMRKYAAFMQRRCGKWYPTSKGTGLHGEARKYLSDYGQSYGEWAEPDDVHQMTWKDCVVTHPEVATAYTAYVMQLMSEIEKTLGNDKESQAYARFGENCRRSYQALVRTKEYSLNTDQQAQLVRPLAFGLLTDKQTTYAKKRLIKAMKHYDWRIGTGFLSTPLILDVLADIDIQAAYRLLENEKLPGWLYMPKAGATTVWESWEGAETKNGGVGSLDHYSKGAVCRWLFDTMCGIRMDDTKENSFIIAPRPGGHFTSASASYRSIYGMVESGWKVSNSEDGSGSIITYTITVPANCSARVILPDGREFIQAAGTRQYHTGG